MSETSSRTKTRTRRLHDHGQSLWLDFIRRRMIVEGRLERYMEEDGLRGITSNPSIFEKAIGGSDDYDPQLEGLLADDPRAGAKELFEALAIVDIRDACDALRPVYQESGGDDGYVSLEVSPYLAYDTEGTVAEVRRLWAEVERPNLMVKVPATPEGVPAIERLTGEGINVNVTLMFSFDHYEAVANAYVAGLEKLADEGDDEALRRVASVASFFVSRVDGKLDPKLAAIGGDEALALLGKVAIANSKRAYRRFTELFRSPDGDGARFARLAERGARVQRVLWGSTSTKNPDYRDVLYVEELIGPDTVNTAPPETIEAFRDHGRVRDTVTEGWDEADETLAALARLGIDLDAVTEELQREGVEKFADSFDGLLAAIEGERRRILAERAGGRQSLFLGRCLGPVGARLEGWQDAGFARRLWAHDRSLWSAEPVDELLDRLGWLTLPDTMPAALPAIERLAAEVAGEADDVVLLGMGGSSLAPEVFQRVFGERPGRPRLTVADSTHPAAVRRAAEETDPARTFYLVSSKSGTTTETLSLFRFFWDRQTRQGAGGGDGEPGRRFAAITDPGSRLAELGRERGFRAVFEAPPEVGGRYSALSHFGLVPAALVGVDVRALVDRAWAAAHAFGPDRPAMLHEALRLGALLAEAARAGRDKLTFVTSPALAAFPDWIEQLVAESLGKAGEGVVPVVGEEVPEGGRADALYAALLLDGDEGVGELRRRLGALEAAGHPVARLTLRDRLELGAEMLRWEMAVAAAGAALGVQPFDQPDVQLAKDLAREAISGAEGEVGAGDGEPVPVGEGAAERVAALLDGTTDGDYVAVHAYLPPTEAIDERLARLRRTLAARTGRAVTVGYGPRFLHSTGQLHKGGPPTGAFLQLVNRAADDLPVPEAEHTFGELIRGQAAGDRRALAQRQRRVEAVSLGDDPAAGLDRLIAELAG